jgi:dynein light chain LC8-type
VANMAPSMAEAIVEISTAALRDEMTEQAACDAIKKQLVEKYPAKMWQVIIGRNFGCFCTHEDGHYIYFYL